MKILKIDYKIDGKMFWRLMDKWFKDDPRKVKKEHQPRPSKLTPEERKQRRRQYYLKNKEKIKEYQDEYHLKNRDKRLEQMKHNKLMKNKSVDKK